MVETKISYTLLKDFKDEDYSSLIEQEKLRAKGYELHFVIDADLIGNYCFPIGIVEEEKKDEERKRKIASPEYLADEQNTLHSIFFLNRGKDRVLLFDQYNYELQAMIYKATKHKADLQKASDILTDILPPGKNGKDLKTILYESFSPIFAKVLMHINGLKKVSNLFTHKAIVFESKDLDNIFLQKACDINKGTVRKTTAITTFFSNRIAGRLYASRERDSVTLDRLLSLNSFIQKYGEGSNKKHLFILLTDSVLLKEVLDDIMQGSNVEYPAIEGQKIQFIRSLPQAFAHLISLEYTEERDVDLNETVENLEALRKTNKDIETEISDTESRINIDIRSSKMFNNWNRLRNEFENTGLLKSFDKLYESVKDDLGNLQLKEVKELFEKIDSERTSIGKEITESHSSYLSWLKDEALFNTQFIYGIEQIRQSDEKFDLSKGYDIIEGSYQHLPVFLTFPKSNESYDKHMSRLLMLVLNRESHNSGKLLKELESIIDSMVLAKSNAEHPHEIKLLKSFLFLILPSHARTVNNNKVVLRWLEKLKDPPIQNQEIYSDLLYMLCWVARRYPDYPASLKYAEEGISKYPTDPRFFHGKFLTLYCLYEEKQQKDVKAIDDMLILIKKASKYYVDFINNHYPEYDPQIILSKLEDTFNNNLCYCLSLKAYALHYSKAKDISQIGELLAQARERLDTLRDENKNYREELPEYFDTEAHLEYLESFYVENKLDKINNAKKAISKAMTLSQKGLTLRYVKKNALIEARITDLTKLSS